MMLSYMEDITVILPMISRGPADALCCVADEGVAMELAAHLFDSCYRGGSWYIGHINTCGRAKIEIRDVGTGWELRWPRFVTHRMHAHYIRQYIAQWAVKNGYAGVTVTLHTAKAGVVA